MPPLTSSLLSRSTTGGSSARGVAVAAAISRPAADAAPSSSSPPARPTPRPRPSPASPFASGLAGRLFGGHRAATRSASSAAAVFERRFASAGMVCDDLGGVAGQIIASGLGRAI
jgi:aconitate hydratase